MVNKKEILISPLDTAFIIRDKKLGVSGASDFMHDMWQQNKSLILAGNEKLFYTDTMYWLDYLENAQASEEEIKQIIKDHVGTTHTKSFSRLSGDNYSTGLYFKRLLTDLTVEQRPFVRAKLLTVMKNHGYVRKTALFSEYVTERTKAYGISMYQNGEMVEDLSNISRNDMVTFRLDKPESTCDVVWNENACIVSLCPPATIDSLLSQRSETGTDRERLLKAMGNRYRYIFWDISKESEPGDIVLFYVPKNGEQRLLRLANKKEAIHSSSVQRVLDEEMSYYTENAGKVVALGVASREVTIQNKTIQIDDLIFLETPIDLSLLDTKVAVNKYTSSTYLPGELWLELRKEIKAQNQKIRI